MTNIAHEKYALSYSFRTPQDEHPEYISNLTRTFCVHWIEHHNAKNGWTCDAVDICKQDTRGALSITLMDGQRHVNQAWHGYTPKELVKFMQGFIFDKPFITSEA